MTIEKGCATGMRQCWSGIVDGRPSPDGRWLAYVAADQGRGEVFVRSLEGGGEWWRLSSGGGVRPFWSVAGDELFFVDPVGTVWGVQVGEGRGFRAPEPARLFDLDAVDAFDNSDCDRVSALPDGRFVIVERGASERPPNRFDLILDLASELERLPPRGR